MIARGPDSPALAVAALGALLAVVAGCAASRDEKPAPLVPPPLLARVSQRCGAPLGPVAPPGSVDAISARVEPGWLARVSLSASEFAPAELDGVAQAPLGAGARLISAELGGAAVEPRVLLAEGAWSVESAEPALFERAAFGRTCPLDRFEGALPSGATLRLEWRSSAPDALAALRLELARESSDASGADLALVFEDEVELDHDSDPATPSVRTLRREGLALERRVAPDAPSAARYVLPAPFPGGQARALLLEIALELRDDPLARTAALERCRASESGALEATRALVANELRAARLAHWAQALALPQGARAALLELASLGGAELCADVALCASQADLTDLARAVAQALDEPGALVAAAGELGWSIERATLNWLATQKDSRVLGYELEGLLVRRTGELGRSAAGLADAARTCASLEQFAQRLVDENWSFLDDHSAATRTRACDWLAARGAAPAGYDPLADKHARRAALAAAEGAR